MTDKAAKKVWIQVSERVFRLFATTDQPWRCDIYEIAPGLWGASAENIVSGRVSDTLRMRHFASDKALLSGALIGAVQSIQKDKPNE